MKYLKKYGSTNEGLRDFMKPKPEEDIVKSIKNYHPDEKLLFGAEHGSLKIIKISIEEGANLGRRGLLGRLIKKENYEIIEFLLDNYQEDLDIDIIELQSDIQLLVLTDNLELIKLLEKFDITLKPVKTTYINIKNCIERERGDKTLRYLSENYHFISTYINFEISVIEKELKKWKQYER